MNRPRRPLPALLLSILLCWLAVPHGFANNKNGPGVPVPTALDFELAAEQDLSGPLAFSYQFPPYLFVDPDGDPMTYQLLEENSADISWLSFDPVTKILSGVPGAAQYGVNVSHLFQLRIRATDNSANSAVTDIIYLTILPPAGNTAPQANQTIPDQSADPGVPFSYVISNLAVLDAESFTKTNSLTLSNGNPIPAWMSFDPWTLELSGTPSAGDAGIVMLTFSAMDQNQLGNSALPFQFTVTGSHNVVSVAAQTTINVAFGTSFGSIPFVSPVQVTLDDASTPNLAVTYSPGSYSGTTAGTHTVFGTLTMIPLVTNTNNVMASVNVVVPKGDQTITFNPLPTRTVADIGTFITLTATASSGLPVSYVSADPSVATITSGNHLNIIGGGSTTITASQGGSANYNAATSVDQPFNVTRLDQTITFNTPSPVTYGDAPFNLTATASSGFAVTYGSSDVNVATVTLSGAVTIVAAGTVTITAFQTGSSTYNPAPTVDRVLTINKANQVITFGPLPGKQLTDPPFQISATVNTGLPITFNSSFPSVAAITPPGDIVAPQAKGTTTITANQAGNSNYNPASVGQLLTIGAQTITFGPIASKVVGDPPFGLSASSSVGLPISYSSSVPGVATVSGGVVTIVGPGTTVITASQSGDATHLAATPVDQPFTVTKASQTISFGPLANKQVTDPPFNLTATATSGLTVTFSSSNPSVATVSGNTVTIVGGGTTNIIANQAGNANYDAAPAVPQQFTVTKLSQTIAFGALPNKVSNDPTFTVSATASSGLSVSFASSNPAVATVSGNTVTITGAGTTTITASQSGNSTYQAAANVPQSLTVIPFAQNQTITFPVIADKTLGDPPFSLTATASSGLPVAYSTTSDKITITGSQVTIVKTGRATIAADQAGNASFNPAATVTRSFCIKPPKPTITGSQLNSPTPMLSSSVDVGNQWYFNGALLVGQTTINLVVSQSGTYTVQARVDDCAGPVSDNFPVVITGDLFDPQTAVKIYPNPVEDQLYVSWPETSGASLLRIYQLDGKEVDHLTSNESELSIPVGHYSSGQYVLSIQTSKAHYQGRFLKR